MLRSLLLSLLIVCGASAFSEDATPASVLAVVPSKFRDCIEPWKKYREAQGYQIKLVDSAANINALQSNVDATVSMMQSSPSAIVIFGDNSVQFAGSTVDPNSQVPSYYVQGPVTASFGSTPKLPTDSLLGDLDHDGKPDIPVGRIPLDRPDQLQPLLNRIAQYEGSLDFGDWRHQMKLVAGVGGFGMLIDGAIESIARGIITSRMPATTQTRVTYASPTSPYFPGYKEFQSSVVNAFNSGSLFWVYAGHGQVTGLDYVPPNASGAPILDSTSISKLKCPATRAPIAFMIACYTGAYDASNDCLAERLLLEPGGPIAVLAGSRMTLPYGNAIVATSMVESWFKQRPRTLGSVWIETLKTVIRENNQPAAPSMLDALAAMMSPTAKKLPEERLEHARLYNLMGDPLLQLRHPEILEINAPVQIEPLDPVTVKGIAPFTGDLTLEVHRRGDPTSQQLAGLSKTEKYQAANTTRIAIANRKINDGEFEITIQLPASALRSVVIVGRLASKDRFALGSDRVLIHKKTKPAQ